MPSDDARNRSMLSNFRRPGSARPSPLAEILERAWRRDPTWQQHAGFVDRHKRLVAASYNIHKCVGTDGRFDPGRILAVIEELDCDVLALQEADRRLGVRAGLLDIADLERRTGLTLVPVATRPDSHGWHGNALFVRQGAATRIRRLDLPCAEPRGAVMAELDIGGVSLRVVGAHLGLLKRTRRRQASALLSTLDRTDPMPTLLMGDFNEWRPDRPDSPLAELEPVFGPFGLSHPSFPSRRPIFALDRILGWPHGTVEDIAVHHTPLARVASDHLPVKALIDISLPLPVFAPHSGT
ncbi:MAG TPA: endonuclease/exonuclease/phosphatase family protein [Methylomirabilota bacterium]|nr:endonuclease/exonuclease/phosphatase family protein [Methylomirabilota bacterium]